MKKQVIYFMFAVLGVLGLHSCGVTQGNRTADSTGTTTTGTTTGTPTGTISTAETRTGTPMGNRPAVTTDRMGARTETAEVAGMQKPVNQRATYRMEEQTSFTHNNKNYTFNPNSKNKENITITRTESGSDVPHGTLSKIGDDGYYIMNTRGDNGQEQILFGKFDDKGNFKAYWYDQETDEVFEENFRTSNRKTETGTNTGTGGNNN